MTYPSRRVLTILCIEGTWGSANLRAVGTVPAASCVSQPHLRRRMTIRGRILPFPRRRDQGSSPEPLQKLRIRAPSRPLHPRRGAQWKPVAHCCAYYRWEAAQWSEPLNAPRQGSHAMDSHLLRHAQAGAASSTIFGGRRASLWTAVLRGVCEMRPLERRPLAFVAWRARCVCAKHLLGSPAARAEEE